MRPVPRIALAQIDTTVGDTDGNAALVLEEVRIALIERADLLLVPELALTGYPPEDLLAKDHFVDDARAALTRVAAACVGIVAVVGFVDRDGDTLYNAAAVCSGGEVRAVYRKRRLPNYGVFDEERYFEPGRIPLLFDVDGVTCALTICEDVWVPELVAEAAELGARIVLNISASPFHSGKGSEREEMLRGRAADNGVHLVYCNLVGGQDELVFDGRSVMIDREGNVIARAAAFRRDMLIADVPAAPSPVREEPLLGGHDEVWSALVLGLSDYFRKNGFADAVIGLSGGIDSALTAALAVDALGAAHVHGVMLPSRYSSEGSVTDARQLCDNLGIDCRTMSIEEPFAAMLSTLEPSLDALPADVTEENLQARVRGTLLMALSNKFGWIALATGNKSELSVGYSTLYGDMVGGFAPIKDLYKTHVYELARWRNRLREVIPAASIEKPPSAELKPGQLDSDALPPYDVLDRVLRAYVEHDSSIEDVIASGVEPDVARRVAKMLDAAEYKRRQGPLGIRVTPKAFGKDRRMPVTNRYRG
jgi:NAD+ synthase (glutamine-hydrolysing)